MYALTLATLIALADAAAGQETIRVSATPAGTPADSSSYAVRTSADGRYVAFLSAATNLVPGDTNARTDVFVADTLAGHTQRVNVGPGGVEANGSSSDPSISADGRYVAFVSSADNLVANDTNGTSDAFVFDRATEQLTRVSLSSSGAEANGASEFPAVAAGGDLVVFASRASNLALNDTDTNLDVFAHDLRTGTTTLVSAPGPSAPSGNGHSTLPEMAADGSVVVFRSDASDLVAGDTNGATDVFVHEFATATLERLSVDGSGIEGNGRSSSPGVSADGRFVSFESLATNLVSASDTNGSWDVFVRDRRASGPASLARVSVNGSGVQGNGFNGRPSISHDGQFVAFWSNSTNLVAGDTNGTEDLFVHSLTTGAVERASVGRFGAEGNGDAKEGRVGFGGRTVAFVSYASNLVPGDTNGVEDIFVRRLAPLPATSLLSATPAAARGDGASTEIDVAADGGFAAFASSATNLVAGDTNGVRDVFVRDLATGGIERVSVSSTGVQADADCASPAISADGRWVAFSTRSATLVPGDNNGEVDVFVRDRATATTRRVSQTAQGQGGNRESRDPSISADGNAVAFATWSTNFAGANPFSSSIYVHDLPTGTLDWVSRGDLPDLSADGRFVALMSPVLLPQRLVFVVDRTTGAVRTASVDPLGRPANAPAWSPSISADGGSVAFHSSATNLTPGITNGVADVFVHDLSTGQTERASLSSFGTEGDGPSEWAQLSGDGRFVVFQSGATTFDPAAGPASGIYLRDRLVGTTTRVDVDSIGVVGNGLSERPSLSADATVIGFASQADNLAPVDRNGDWDVFAHRRCDLVFEPFGAGLAGTNGITPHLAGVGQTCASYDLRVWNALAGAPGILAVGFGEGAVPFLGGTLYLDLGQPIVTVPFTAQPSGLPGLGAAYLHLGSLGGLSSSTLVLQVGVFDAQAPAGVALTRALRLRINH